VFAQVLCELACVIDDGARARRWLAVADQHALIDHDWLEFHPLLAPLRGDSSFAALRARVLARTDAIWADDGSAVPAAQAAVEGRGADAELLGGGGLLTGVARERGEDRGALELLQRDRCG